MIAIRGVFLALVLAAVAPSVAAQPAPPARAAQPPPLYICIYRPGPAWVADKPLDQQDLRPHTAFIKRLLDEGRLFAGGRTVDVDGGLAIFRAASLEEARGVLAADPALISGVLVAELHAWQPLFDSGKPLRP